jgi:hypothetical protein
MVSLRDVHAEEIRRFRDVLVEVRKELGIEWEPKLPQRIHPCPKKIGRPFLCWITESIHTYLFPERVSMSLKVNKKLEVMPCQNKGL